MPTNYPTGVLLGCVNVDDVLPQKQYRAAVSPTTFTTGYIGVLLSSVWLSHVSWTRRWRWRRLTQKVKHPLRVYQSIIDKSYAVWLTLRWIPSFFKAVYGDVSTSSVWYDLNMSMSTNYSVYNRPARWRKSRDVHFTRWHCFVSLQFPDGESNSPYVFICSNPRELLIKPTMTGQHKICRCFLSRSHWSFFQVVWYLVEYLFRCEIDEFR